MNTQTQAAEVVGSSGEVGRPAQDWIRDVEPGHMLRIRPLWNNTERGPNCIPVPCKLLAVQLGVHGCQSGALFTVRTKGGSDRTLDAGWFQPPNTGNDRAA